MGGGTDTGSERGTDEGRTPSDKFPMKISSDTVEICTSRLTTSMAPLGIAEKEPIGIPGPWAFPDYLCKEAYTVSVKNTFIVCEAIGERSRVIYDGPNGFRQGLEIESAAWGTVTEDLQDGTCMVLWDGKDSVSNVMSLGQLRPMVCDCSPGTMPCQWYFKKNRDCTKGDTCKMCHHFPGPRKARPCKWKRQKNQERLALEKERAENDIYVKQGISKSMPMEKQHRKFHNA